MTAAISFFAIGTSTAQATASAQVSPYATTWVDLPREPGFAAIPAGTWGWIRVTSTGPGQSMKVLAAVLDRQVDADGRAGTAAAWEAIPADAAGRRIAVPLFRHRHTTAELITGIQVMNTDPDRPATATLRLIDDQGQVIPGGGDRTVVIARNSAHVWYTPAISGVHDRPGLYGSAIIESDLPLAVVVNEMSANGTSDAAAYVGEAVEIRE